jgi:hypothetical protein
MSKSPLIWFSDAVKFLRNKISFSNQVSIEAGSVDPSSSATDGLEGSLYLSSNTKKLYVKTDNGNSANWTEVVGGGAPVTNCRLLDIVVFDSNGTYNKNPNAAYIIVEAVGAGGSGGTANAAFSSNLSQGAGGGGGEYGYKVIDNGDVGDTETVTVGVGVSASNGGTTSFGTHLTAVGGNVGGNGGAPGYSTGGNGGSGGTGGDFYIKGCDGSNSGTTGTSSTQPSQSGIGGASYWSGFRRVSPSAGTAGFNGKLYGGGGSGGFANTSTAQLGGIGGNGRVIIREYGNNE